MNFFEFDCSISFVSSIRNLHVSSISLVFEKLNLSKLDQTFLSFSILNTRDFIDPIDNTIQNLANNKIKSNFYKN